MNVINIDDYRPKTDAFRKAEFFINAKKDYIRRLRNYGYPENKFNYMVDIFLQKLAIEIKDRG